MDKKCSQLIIGQSIIHSFNPKPFKNMDTAIYALNNAQTHHQTHITLQAPQTSMAAVVSMIFGIIGIFFTWWVLAIPSVIAIIAGHVARSNIASSHGKLGGDGFAIAGLILGYIVIALYILVAFIFVGAISALSSIR